MNTIIYYFSGTGNSLHTARELADRLGGTELVSIPQAMRQGNFRVTAKRIGLVFPLYYVGLPKVVLDFITKADFSQTAYSFAVITRGVNLVGGAIHHLKDLLRQKSGKLDAGFYINMPQNYVPWLNVPKETKQQRLFQKAEQKLGYIASTIENIRSHYEIEPFFFMRAPRNTPYLKTANQKDRQFSIGESCNGCGICQKVCPVQNITLQDGTPQWRHQCQECLACLHFCPQKTLQFGKNTVKKDRYHHPNITAKDMMTTGQ